MLRQAGFSFTVITPPPDEPENLSMLPHEIVKTLSQQKALYALEQAEKPAVIIGADTIVCIQGKVLGKPDSPQTAFQMLSALSGRCHTVYTGVTLIKAEENGYTLKHVIDQAAVRMRSLSEKEINAYIATGEPLDKAGSYGAQEKGALLIERIDGDYHTVIGLPLSKVYGALREWGIEAADFWA